MAKKTVTRGTGAKFAQLFQKFSPVKKSASTAGLSVHTLVKGRLQFTHIIKKEATIHTERSKLEGKMR